MSAGWYGVDLDGTLAEYHGWKGVDHIGVVIPLMRERIQRMIDGGKTVKIFTARVSEQRGISVTATRRAVQDWLEENGLPRLEVVCCKDFGMIELWDDRAICVKHNTGEILGRNP